jgi:hypothetical protein
MVNRELENILEQEYENITRREAPGESAGFLDMIRILADEPASDDSKQTRPPRPMPSLAQPSPASSINHGYMLPGASNTQDIKSPQSSIAAAVGTSALRIFSSALGVMPLVSGLASLFGGGKPPAQPALVKYAMPRSIKITAANSKDSGTLSYADYDQGGAVRSFGTRSNAAFAQPAAGSHAPGNASGGQVIVNVQAIDSRSFLDHSQEIAQAVREAMLNMHSLNDVVGEL